jgi:hypothetical protein
VIYKQKKKHESFAVLFLRSAAAFSFKVFLSHPFPQQMKNNGGLGELLYI